MKKENIKEMKTNITIIDLQDKSDFNISHIKNSINIPYEDLMQNYKYYLKKNKTYYITCKKGHLSKRAVSILDYLGYDVIMLEK